MTALPQASNFTGPITEGDFKAAMTAMRDFQAVLFGTDGTVATALATLGAPASVYLPKTAAYTVAVADRGRLIDATTGTWSLSLLAAASAGSGFSVIVRNSGAGVITIDPAGTELIDGAATKTLAAGRAMILMCTGTAWVSQPMLAALTAAEVSGLAAVATAGNFASLTGALQIAANIFSIADPTDATRRIKFDASGVPTTVTRTVSAPAMDGPMAIDPGVNAFGGAVTDLTFGTKYRATQTPTGDRAYTTSNLPPATTPCILVITTTGTVSRALTFGSGFLNSAPLATGTVSGKVFTLTFIASAAGLVETGRVGPV
jgi:hypothetical protein